MVQVVSVTLKITRFSASLFLKPSRTLFRSLTRAEGNREVSPPKGQEIPTHADGYAIAQREALGYSTQALRAKMIQALANYLDEARRTHMKDDEKRAA